MKLTIFMPTMVLKLGTALHYRLYIIKERIGIVNHKCVESPNLIYVFADQLRFSSCGFAGNARARTPNIDCLARESINFCNAVSGSPVCAPYRASVFTGKYSSSTGMVINELRLNPNHKCFGHVLRDGGYNTAYIGKWHLWANELGNHRDPKNAFAPPGLYRFGFDGYWAAYNFWHEYYTARYYHDTPAPISVEGYEPDVQTNLAIEQLRRHRDSDKPFALFLSYGTPHDPWNKENVPPQYYDMFRDVEFGFPPNYKPENDPYADPWARLNPAERAQLDEWQRVYYAMTANLDWNVGRLLQAVNDLGLRDHTICVFTSDHGEMFGAHGRRAKNIFYEEAIRVPFLLRYPGHHVPGQVSDVCLNTPDVMPTLLPLMGLSVPDTVEGMDLSHYILGEAGPEPEAAYMQGMGCTAAWEDGYEWRALRDKRYTYAIMYVDGAEFLFDNKNDPYQMVNLVDDKDKDHQSILQGFRDLLKQRMFELSTSATKMAKPG
ncbi:MAG: sulfatase [Limnochordia bacterium]|nr:sulfatase [Limnochordia bacterium]